MYIWIFAAASLAFFFFLGRYYGQRERSRIEAREQRQLSSQSTRSKQVTSPNYKAMTDRDKGGAVIDLIRFDGPKSAEELLNILDWDRAKLDEVLEQTVQAQLFTYDPESRRYSCPYV
jgi:hypothetical protein